MIDSIPGLKSAANRSDVTFINMDSDETSPKTTEGFTDEDIRKMRNDALNDQLNSIAKEEETLTRLQLELVKRRNSILNIMARKQEIT
jgi:hypothetical protein